MSKFIGKRMVRVEPCKFQKKHELLIMNDRRGYSTANIGKVLSNGPYEGTYIVYLKNRLRTFFLNQEKCYTVPTIDVLAEVIPEDDEEVIFQKDMPSLRHPDDIML